MTDTGKTHDQLEDEFVNYIKPYRTSEVRHIVNTLDKYDIPTLRRTINYYPLRFLADGVAAYRYGFNEASIFHAGASVELGLVGMMQEKVNRLIQSNPKLRIDFKWLIQNSGDLLDTNGRTMCNDIRLMRNCYIHYENVIAHLGFMEQVEHPMLMEIIRQEYGDNPETMAQISELEKSLNAKRDNGGMLGIRFEHLEKQEIFSFISRRYGEYINWFSSLESVRSRTVTEKEREVIYIHEAFDARECLTWAFEVLKKLGIIIEN